MAYTLNYDLSTGSSVIEVTVEDEKTLFKAGHFLANLPRFCPFDGQLTRLHYSTDAKEHEYFGVCSIANERLKFRFGVRENATKDLYPYGWTYWEDIEQSDGQTRRYTWHWVNGEWREYALEAGSKKDKDKIVHMDRIRRKLFPKLDPLLPVFTAPSTSQAPAVSLAPEPDPEPASKQAEPARTKNPNMTKARTELESVIATLCNFGGDTDIALATPWIVTQWTNRHAPVTNRIDFLTEDELVEMAADLVRLKDSIREKCKIYLNSMKQSAGK